MRKNYIGDIIYKARKDAGLTQDQYGAKYALSGPAIFKYEKGFMFPSLELWMRMAADAGVSERRAVLLRVKSRLPEQYQEYIELQGAAAAESGKRNTSKTGKPDYATFETREEMRAVARSGPSSRSSWARTDGLLNSSKHGSAMRGVVQGPIRQMSPSLTAPLVGS